MKKFVIATAVTALMTTSVFAEVGTIVKVIAKSNNTAKIVLDPADTAKANQACNIDLTTEAGKAILAVALTGKSTGMSADIYRDSSNNCTNVGLIQ